MTTHAVTPAHSRMALTPHGTDNNKSLGAGISWATLVTIRTAARPQAGNLTWSLTQVGVQGASEKQMPCSTQTTSP